LRSYKPLFARSIHLRSPAPRDGHNCPAPAPARARSALHGAKTRGDNEQGGAHRHLHLPASTAERAASCPLRVRPAHRTSLRRRGCGSSGQLAAAPAGRPPGRQRVHPPVASARQSRAPALGRPAPSLTIDGAQACSMHVTVCMHVTSFLKMCRKAQEGTRAGAVAGAGSLYLLLSFPDTRRRARALFPLFPEPSVPGLIRS